MQIKHVCLKGSSMINYDFKYWKQYSNPNFKTYLYGYLFQKKLSNKGS